MKISSLGGGAALAEGLQNAPWPCRSLLLCACADAPAKANNKSIKKEKQKIAIKNNENQ